MGEIGMDLIYWIWLSLRCGAGSESGSYLLSKFSSPKEIYDLDKEQIDKIDGVDGEVKTSLCDKDLSRPAHTLDFCRRKHVHIMTLESPEYPERLRAIYAKPIVLYYVGSLPRIDSEPLIACVGSRECSEYGFSAAYKLGAELTLAGATVVSGLAAGIDSACARGALSANGRTIAVIGCGIDVVYPRDNRELYRQIARNGAIITEYAPQTPPTADHFPVRNRIISGLCVATCIVEAGAKSGALITARHAEMQGRKVYALPGRAGDDESYGNLDLIYKGANFVRGAADIVSDLSPLYPSKLFLRNIPKDKYVNKRGKKSGARFENIRKTDDETGAPAPEHSEIAVSMTADLSSLTDVERAVYASLEKYFTPGEIRAAVATEYGKNLGVGEVLAALTTLEILGLCTALPGGNYVRKEKSC